MRKPSTIKHNRKQRKQYEGLKCKVCFQPTLCHHDYCPEHYEEKLVRVRRTWDIDN